ncbi:MAG: hypothetical protein K1X56_00605 [Flavobacteriales bacterium]|nr:hypothetical protein [Flavobacteriales bacterium]
MEFNRGIITLAQGKQRYIDMAVNLAKSIRLNSPGLPIAVITDRPEAEMKKWFDYVVPVNPRHGLGLVQKVYLYDYSPFSETIFIDSDCLVVNDFSFLWDLFQGNDVSAIGEKLIDGNWAGMSVTETCDRLKLPYIVQLNGGVYYFKKNDTAAAVFSNAQKLIEAYDTIGIARLRGQVNEEPLMSLSMAQFGLSPINDNGKGMRTPVGQKGVFRMDILKGYCSFLKHNIKVEPVIMHFGGGYPEAFHYRREVLKMKIYLATRIPKFIISAFVNGFANSFYAMYVFAYRCLKFIMGKSKFKMSPLLPMFKFE